MVQEAKRDAEMEKVYGVFEGYIKASPYIEWLWSEKLGYILSQKMCCGSGTANIHLMRRMIWKSVRLKKR